MKYILFHLPPTSRKLNQWLPCSCFDYNESLPSIPSPDETCVLSFRMRRSDVFSSFMFEVDITPVIGTRERNVFLNDPGHIQRRPSILRMIVSTLPDFHAFPERDKYPLSFSLRAIFVEPSPSFRQSTMNPRMTCSSGSSTYS